MNKILIVDVDEVLLQWFSSFVRYCRAYHHINYPQNDYRTLTDVLGYDKAIELVDKFNSTPKMFANLHPYHDALVVVPRLFKKGWSIIAVTACGRDNKTYAMRKVNLESVFGPIFKEIFTVNYGESKSEYLLKFPNAWFVDDMFHNIEDGYKNGVKCIHMPRVFDKDKSLSGVNKVANWYDVEKLIL